MTHATTQVVTALSRTLRRNAAALAREFARARRGESGAVHRVRVATRRLRATLPLAADAGRLDARALSRDLRRVTRALGEVREADVVRELLLDLADGQTWPASVVVHVEEACRDRQERQHASLRARLGRLHGRELRERVDMVADRIDERTTDGKASAVLLAEVRRRARRLSEAMAEAGTVYGIDSLHQVRLATKKLRYALEAADGVLGSEAERARRRLKRHQDRLGRIHDAQMAQHYVRAAAAGADVTPGLSARLTSVDRALEVRCRRLHGHALAASPRMAETVQDVLDAVAARIAPRHVGRMARMRAGKSPRRAAAEA